MLGGTADNSWDLIYTDVIIGSLPSMIELLSMRRGFSNSGVFRLIDLRNVQFAAATAYIVNPNSKDKLLSLLRGIGSLDRPYDFYLRDLVNGQKLRAFVIFPFVTTLSEHAEKSNIQEHDYHAADLTLNAFRKLMWLERDADAAVAALDRI